MVYSFAEYADMHLMYGLANCSTLEARRLYTERYPDRPLPIRNTFLRVDQRIRETGSVKINRSQDTNGNRRDVENEENILEDVYNNPGTSVRKLSAEHNVPKFSVFRILKEQQLYPFHFNKVQALVAADFLPRLNFANWFIQNLNADPLFSKRILFTDEAGFSKNGVFNTHNLHRWDEENPHGLLPTRSQFQFPPINIWAGIIGNYLIGPFVLPNRLNGAGYLNFLQNNLHDLLDAVDLETRNNMLFMQDGAPPHYTRIVREHLDNSFPNRWIGRGGPIHWPPRSPDLTPLDFFLWGHLKGLVYSKPVQNREELMNRFFLSFEEIKQNVNLFNVQQSLVSRMRKCIEENGGYVEGGG